MHTHILIPTDGSDLSLRPMRPAVARSEVGCIWGR